MLLRCCTQYASKFGKLSSGHRTGKGQFSFQSQRKAMPKNVQTTTQLQSSHLLGRVPTCRIFGNRNPRKVKLLSCARLFATPWTAAYQAPLSMGFYRQEYTEELYKKDLHDPDNHDGVIPHLEPNILECEVKWALGSITMN